MPINSETCSYPFLQRLDLSSENCAVITAYDKKNYSYKDLNERSNRLASFLKNELNLLKNDVIAFIGENSVEYIDAFYASLKTGIIITTYNHSLSINELKEIYNKETPKVVFVGSGICIPIKKYLEQEILNNKIKVVEFGSCKLNNSIKYKDILCYYSEKVVKESILSSKDIIMYIHTGGTTGVPKTALITIEGIINNAINQLLFYSLNKEELTYCYLPFFHTANWNILMLPTLLIGGTVILDNKFHTNNFFDTIRCYKPTISVGVPTTYQKLANEKYFDGVDFSCFRFLLCGAAPVNSEIVWKYLNKDVIFLSGYGMTETGPCNTSLPLNFIDNDLLKEKIESVGIPFPFNDVKILSNNQVITKQSGISGEILIKNNSSSLGYLDTKSSIKQIEKYEEDWILTGDIGQFDEEGYLYILDRKKRMFISGGENLFPREIEKVIEGNEYVKQSYVYPVEDKVWGEVPEVEICLKIDNDSAKSSVLKTIKEQLSKIKQPKKIHFVDEILVNDIGKTIKKK